MNLYHLYLGVTAVLLAIVIGVMTMAALHGRRRVE